MTRKQICALVVVTAMLILTGLAVWKLGYADVNESGGSGGAVAILTSSIALYIAYLFATLPGRRDRRK